MAIPAAGEEQGSPTREMARNLLQTAAEVQRLLDQAGEPAL